MNIQAEKLNLIQWLESVNDNKIIKQFMLLKRSSEGETSVRLTTKEKDAIDQGLDSLNEGRSKSHAEVMEITRKKYPHLFK